MKSRSPVAETQNLTGLQKVAIVLLAIGTEAATAITKSFSQTELEEISIEIARLGKVPAEVVTAVLREWGQLELAAHTVAVGGMDAVQDFLERTVGNPKAAAILKRVQTQLGESPGLGAMRNADPRQVAGLLREEHPQAIALMAAQFGPEQTAAIVAALPRKLGSEVLRRLARLQKVSPDVLQILDRVYGNETSVAIAQELAVAGGPEAAAAVVNRLKGPIESELLEGIADEDPEMADRIKDLMFVFEDIAGLDDRSLQRLLREIAQKELALGLKAASDALKQRIRSQMSSRAADALQEEMEFLGPVRLRDVEEAQAAVVRVVRQLAESGDVVVGGGDDEMVA